MALDFKSLKKNSKAIFESVVNKAKAQNTSSFKADEREWSPTVGKDGNGFAIVRFMPSPPNEDMPFQRLFKHAFKGPGNVWYIENCPTTIGGKCPACEYNSVLWNSGIKSKKDVASKQKRNLIYKSNVYVVTDSAKKEAEGKVHIFNYGKKIYDKLDSKMNPKFEGEEALDPFNLWDGADFKIKIHMVTDGNRKYRNYDNSEFAASAPLSKDEKKLEALWNSCYGLEEFVKPDQFKTYDELKVKLNRTLGLGQSVGESVAGEVLIPQDLNGENPDFSGATDPVGDDDGAELFEKLAKMDA